MEHGPIKLGMIIVMQPSLADAVSFYKDVLKLPLKFHLKDKWAEFDLGCVKFGLCPIGQKQDNIRTGIVIETDQDIKGLYESHKDSITFLSEPVVAVHGVMIGFKDPGGNILDLYQPTPEKVKELAKKHKNSDIGCKAASADCPCDIDEDAPNLAEEHEISDFDDSSDADSDDDDGGDDGE